MRSEKNKGITRREFLKDTTAAAIAGTLYLAGGTTDAGSEAQTTVVLIRHRNALDSRGHPSGVIIKKMLDDALCALANKANPKAAWKRFIKSSDRVGIKTNVWSYLPTPAPLEEAIKRGVMSAGVAENAITIRDRGIYSDEHFLKSTALINVRPLRTHYWAGVGSLLKNYITFVPRPYEYHGDTCADLARIWNLPAVKGKTRLNILVMLTPLFHGIGPHHFNPRYVWNYCGMLVGTDPVAVDATGVRILQAQRLRFFGKDRPINPPPKHILLADTRHHLGTADPRKIKLIKIGWMSDSLI
jgi:hypothetical protein